MTDTKDINEQGAGLAMRRGLADRLLANASTPERSGPQGRPQKRRSFLYTTYYLFY